MGINLFIYYSLQSLGDYICGFSKSREKRVWKNGIFSHFTCTAGNIDLMVGKKYVEVLVMFPGCSLSQKQCRTERKSYSLPAGKLAIRVLKASNCVVCTRSPQSILQLHLEIKTIMSFDYFIQ